MHLQAEPAGPAAVDRGTARRLAAPVAVGVAAAACCAVVAVVDPSERSLTPPCPLLSVSGYACPLCGATRGMHHLLNGRVATAVSYNALVPVIAVLAVVAWLAWAARRASAAPGRSRPLPTWLPLAGLGALVVFGVVRNLPWGPFPALAP